MQSPAFSRALRYPRRMLAALLLACPQVLTPPMVVIAAGCPAPADGVLYSFEADSDRHSDSIASAAALRLCRASTVEARSEVDRAGHAMLGRIQACSAELVDAADELDAAAATLDAMAERAAALERGESSRLPAWVWVLAGAGAPLAAVGVCSDGRCSTLGTWAAAGGSLAAVAAAGVAWEW